MADVQRNASLAHRAEPGGSPGAAATTPGGISRVPELLSATTDAADYIDDEVVESSRWMDTEVAVGSIVAILVVAALVAVWVSCRRRRRRDSPTPEATGTGTTAECMRATMKEVSEIQRKISSIKPLSLQLPNGKDANGKDANGKDANGVTNGSTNGTAVPVATIVLSSTPSPLPDPTAQVTASPWEPYFLGAPGKRGKPLRARRRSVSLRSADDDGGGSDDATSGVSGTSSRGPSPSPSLSPRSAEDGEATRKRSVTFNAMVEEVQILVR